MANKQFSMEKKIENISVHSYFTIYCEISVHTDVLSKTNTFNLYMKKSLNTFFYENFVFCRFVDQISNVFFIQYLNILQFTTCVLVF